MDQLKSAHQLDRRSKFRFYLRLFFDLFDVALHNSYIIYKFTKLWITKMFLAKISNCALLIDSLVDLSTGNCPIHCILLRNVVEYKNLVQHLQCIYQSFWRNEDAVQNVQKMERKVEQSVHVPCVMLHFAYKKTEIVLLTFIHKKQWFIHFFDIINTYISIIVQVSHFWIS